MIDTRVPSITLVYKLVDFAIIKIKDGASEKALDTLELVKRTLDYIADV